MRDTADALVVAGCELMGLVSGWREVGGLLHVSV